MSEALGDRNPDTQTTVLDAGMAIIETQGKEYVLLLLPTFEDYVASISTKTESHNIVGQSVVVLLGLPCAALEQRRPESADCD